MQPLVIRNEQMDALREARKQEEYRRRVKVYLQEHPELCEGQGPEELLETVTWAMTKAASYGLLGNAAPRYVPYVLQYGRDFEQREDMAWAAAILRDRDLVGPHKMDRLDASAHDF